MVKNIEPIIIYTSFANIQQAKMMARGLIRCKHAVCVNIIPEIISCYQWQGDFNEEIECAILIKTTRKYLADVTDYIEKHHNYEVPNISVWDVSQASQPFLKWMDDQLDRKTHDTSSDEISDE